MGGQVLGGGVVVLVAVLLWLLYLLPSWQGRHRYYAAERNAVRLNQALRVLAATSEAPEEVHVELNARTALAQQKLARAVQSEREQVERENAKAEHEAQLARIRAEAAVARQVALVARERARAEAAAAAAAPAVRRARARRRARLIATVLGLAAVGAAAWGAVLLAAGGSSAVLWAGVVGALVCGVLLQRMAAVQRRAGARALAGSLDFSVDPAARAAATVQDVALASDRAGWTPRELPRPLTVSAGSRAAAVLDGAAAREALRHAAVDEAIRAQAARVAPPSIEVARAERQAALSGAAAAGDDAAIEAHVRELLRDRGGFGVSRTA